MSAKVLITGYGPFVDCKINPSEQVVNYLESFQAESESALEFEFDILPVSFEDIESKLIEVNLDQYDYIILMGLAASRSYISFEKVAINWCYSPGRVDNRGKSFNVGRLLVNDGALAYFSELKLEQMSKYFSERDLNSKVSFTAGTYVCNATYYYALQKVDSSKCCFIHLPKNLDIKKFSHTLIEYLQELENK